MIIRVLIFSFTLFHCVDSINQVCTKNQQCPDHSQCQQGQCICSFSYILDCEVKADPLGTTPTSYEISDQISYFVVFPEEEDQQFIYVLTACSHQKQQLNQYVVVFSAFVDQGDAKLTQKNYIGTQEISLENLRKTCLRVGEIQESLGLQPNGEPETIIIIAYLEPKSSSEKNHDPQFQISLSVQIYESSEDNPFFIYLAIGIIVFTIIAAIGSIIFCLYFRWRLRRQQGIAAQNKKMMIEHIKQLIPEEEVRYLNLPLLTSCSICLGEFEPSDKVRKLVCSHIFHTGCIDSWCMKNMNCPVCRFQLHPESIKQRILERKQTQHLKWQINSLTHKQSLVENLENPYSHSLDLQRDN